MTNNQKDNIVDRQTIQWARESLQRRRRELQEKKKNLVLQYGGRESPTTSQQTREEETAAPSAAAITTSDDDDVVNTILEKGRTLLGTAEAHTEILGRYANANNNANTADTKDAVENDDNDTSPNDHKLNFDNVNLPVEAPGWKKDDDGSSEQQSMYLENDEKELQELLPQEGDARARLDELIASVRRQGHHRHGTHPSDQGRRLRSVAARQSCGRSVDGQIAVRNGDARADRPPHQPGAHPARSAG